MKGQNMTQLKSSQSEHASVGRATIGRLFVLEASGNRVLSLNPDGSDRKVIVTDCRIPDGIAVDVEAGHIYWTNMGVPNRNDGSIERADLDGRNRKTIIPQGGTFTPKQLQLDKENGKLYWCDREGMRVMRANLDGSNIETLVDTSHGDPRPGPDATRWCVGIAVDPERGHFYWTQKGPEKGGLGRLFRANNEIPKGENAVNRTDVEVLFDDLPEPIDLELDLKNRLLYWTDRGDPPRGNTVNRAPMDVGGEPGALATGGRPAPKILYQHLMEGIGIAIDFKGGRMFITDLAGSVYSAGLDGSEKRTLLAAQGNLTGIAYVE
jgi:DNA-binding beta-propeller fold protein YncE